MIFKLTTKGTTHMTRDEVLARLVAARAVFDEKLSKVPHDKVDAEIEGRHTVKDVLVHISAYEELIVRRLRAAREGETTEFDRDRDGWEAFNDRIWVEARKVDISTAYDLSKAVFIDLLIEVRQLTDEELNEVTGITEHIDPAWLDGKRLWEMIGIDGFDHYPMHHKVLEAP